MRPGAEAFTLSDGAGRPCGFGRSGAIVELSLELSALGLAPHDKVGLLVRVLQDEVEQERLPRYGDLPLSVPGRGFDQLNWQV